MNILIRFVDHSAISLHDVGRTEEDGKWMMVYDDTDCLMASVRADTILYVKWAAETIEEEADNGKPEVPVRH
jgi:hypothetical protein